MKKGILSKICIAVLVTITILPIIGCGSSTEVNEELTKTEAVEAKDKNTNDVEAEGEGQTVNYESEDGWKISYDTEKFFLNDTLGDGEVAFNYVGECSGTTAIIISYVPGKMPNEVLYEKVADIDDERIERGEATFGKELYWSHYRHIKPVNEDPEAGDVVYEGFTAIEHNGGTVLIDSIEHFEADEVQYSDIINAKSELLNAFVLLNHELQTEYAYVPGTYIYKFSEEIEGEMLEFENSVVMNEDHTCEVSFQDTIVGEWNGTEIVLNDGSSFEYTIEGDELMLNEGENWIEFVKQ